MILAKTDCFVTKTTEGGETKVKWNESITSATIWNGYLTLGSKKGGIFLFDPETLEFENRLNPHESSVRKLYVLPSSSTEKNKDLLVSFCFGGQISLFNSYLDMIDFKSPHKDVIWDMVVLPRDENNRHYRKKKVDRAEVHRILTVSSDKFMKIHEIDELIIKTNVEEYETGNPLISICLSPEPTFSETSKYFAKKRFLFGCDTNRDIKIFDLESMNTLFTFDSLHQGWVTNIFSFYLPKQRDDVLEKRLIVASISEKSSIHLHLVNRLLLDAKTKTRAKIRKKKKIKTLFRKIGKLHTFSNCMLRLRHLHYCGNLTDHRDPIYVLSAGKDGIIKKVNLSRSECVKQFSNVHKKPETGENIRTVFQLPNHPEHIISCDTDGNIIKWTMKDDIKSLISQEREEKLDDNIFVEYPVSNVMISENKKKFSGDFKNRLIGLLRIKSEEKREKIKQTCSFFTIFKMLYQQIKKVNDQYTPEKIEKILETSRNERNEDIFMILKVRKTGRPYLVHKDIVMYKSDFLFKTVTFGGQETQDFEDSRIVSIEVSDFQNNPLVMDHFIEYLYKDFVSSQNFGVFLNLFHFSNVYFENDLRDYMFEKIKKVSQKLVKQRRFEMYIIEYGYLIENQETLDSLLSFWETLDFGSLNDRINSYAFCDQPEELLLEKEEMKRKEEELGRMSEKTQTEVKRREMEMLKKLKKSEEDRKRVIEDFDQRKEIYQMVIDSRRVHGSQIFGVVEEEKEEEEEGEVMMVDVVGEEFDLD